MAELMAPVEVGTRQIARKQTQFTRLRDLDHDLAISLKEWDSANDAVGEANKGKSRSVLARDERGREAV